MKMTGEMIIKRVCQRMADGGSMCFDFEIVSEIRNLTWQEVAQLVELGDVCQWRDERIKES